MSDATQPILKAEHLGITFGGLKAVSNFNMTINKGELIGLIGPNGAGKTTVFNLLTKVYKPTRGKILLNGEDVSHASIRYRNVHGLAHVPEDRHKYGLILDNTLEENLAMRKYFRKEFQNHGFIRFDETRKYAEKLIEQYDVRSGQGPVTIARSMSGGNQQKAIVAREIDKDPELLIAVQPTRGLDVGAIEYIHKQIVAQRDAGKAVLLVSLELDEVMSLSDRILVIYEGEIVGELDPKTTTAEEMGLYMAGAKRKGA